MKLNAQILYERLKRIYPVKMYGECTSKMLFSSAEFYMDNTVRFHNGHVYLATAEHLPHRPMIEKDVLIVCIGENARLAYYKTHASVILIKKNVDFFEVYKNLQNIFEAFHKWESSLLELFMKSPTIQEVLDCTYPVLERAVFVLNSSFQYVAAAYSRRGFQNENWNQAEGNLDTGAFLAFLKEKDLSMDKKGAFLLDFESVKVLCVNLFNSNDDYIGCLCIDQTACPFLEGEDKLAEFLAAAIEKISEGNPILLSSERGSLKNILQTLMNEMPLSKNQKILLKSANLKQDYLCVSIHYQKHFSSFPVSYICSVFESLFSNSIFFEQNNAILGLIPTSAFVDSSAQMPEEKIRPLTEKMQLCIGISNDFNDLYMLHTYYRQAEAAIENGHIYRPEQNLYYFSDFVLPEMISNSLDGLPVEAYFPKGFRELLTHDQNSVISYLETLSVFLEENMSCAKAARRLFIHRSTLIERLSRIENDLSLDLDNPEQRLFVQILLKALSIEKFLKEQ